MYLIRNFSIKPHACVVFDPDCLKRSYGVNHTVESADKVVICYVRIMKVIIICVLTCSTCLRARVLDLLEC